MPVVLQAAALAVELLGQAAVISQAVAFWQELAVPESAFVQLPVQVMALKPFSSGRGGRLHANSCQNDKACFYLWAYLRFLQEQIRYLSFSVLVFRKRLKKFRKTAILMK